MTNAAARMAVQIHGLKHCPSLVCLPQRQAMQSRSSGVRSRWARRRIDTPCPQATVSSPYLRAPQHLSVQRMIHHLLWHSPPKRRQNHSQARTPAAKRSKCHSRATHPLRGASFVKATRLNLSFSRDRLLFCHRSRLIIRGFLSPCLIELMRCNGLAIAFPVCLSCLFAIENLVSVRRLGVCAASYITAIAISPQPRKQVLWEHHSRVCSGVIASWAAKSLPRVRVQWGGLQWVWVVCTSFFPPTTANLASASHHTRSY